jgi:hypothetical protein
MYSTGCGIRFDNIETVIPYRLYTAQDVKTSERVAIKFVEHNRSNAHRVGEKVPVGRSHERPCMW